MPLCVSAESDAWGGETRKERVGNQETQHEHDDGGAEGNKQGWGARGEKNWRES